MSFKIKDGHWLGAEDSFRSHVHNFVSRSAASSMGSRVDVSFVAYGKPVFHLGARDNPRALSPNPSVPLGKCLFTLCCC